MASQSKNASARARMHGQPKNIMPLASSVGWAEALYNNNDNLLIYTSLPEHCQVNITTDAHSKHSVSP